MELYIGIMSGTSMDGIDAVLVSFERQKVQVIESCSQAFPVDLVADLNQLLDNYQTTLQKVGEIDHRLALCYSGAVQNLIGKFAIHSQPIKAIGFHGQTVFHSPDSQYPFTMQLGDANLLAAKTGIRTVADFRRMDMAFGGGGAPLAPAFHQAFFNDRHEKRVILNLGGIANITILSSRDEKVPGFDTGPANCLMDSWIQWKKGQKYDKDGAWAASGKVIDKLLNEMLNENYFKQPAPKSTGRELFNLKWLNKNLEKNSGLKNEDIQATLLELTAVSIAQSINIYAPLTNAIYACGGGAYNKQLMERLSYHLPDVKVATTEELGVHPQQVEAVAFAWLAMQRINNQPGNLPSVTGASRKVLLGTIYEPATFS